MEYVSSDTNVWIDFKTIDKLALPFKLPFTYLMNQDAIKDELLSPKGLKDELINLGLQPVELNEEEFFYGLSISEQHPKLSKYDCIALAIAKKRKIVLLTGDLALRKVAQLENVTVMGTIGILDELHNTSTITKAEYRECLTRLLEENGREVRLPEIELQNRINNIK